VEDLSGRVVLVTGASRGIGLEVARVLAGAGARVAMVARGEEELARTADEIGAHAIACDVASEAGVADLADRLREWGGSAPDAIVHSAGAFVLAPLTATEPHEFDRVLRVNLRAPFLLNRALLPAMLERGSGHIVTLGSIAGRLALPGNSAYSASKYGLRGMHEVLVEELRGSGVRATLVEPAATDTPLWNPLDPDSRADLPSRSQMLRPADVARAVHYVLAQPHTVEISYLAIRAAG
jgi:NAD(P)-dependent dehydrogenase (short-subunit alcohol dehydrogenase family)